MLYCFKREVTMKKQQNIYDNNIFFNEYVDMRENKLNANDLLEIPTIISMLPDLKGKTVLDLGCGYGKMSKYFISQGAQRVVAIDLSKNMINKAKKQNKDKNIDYLVMAMEDISKIKEKFDLVFSSLAFHYVEDFDKLIKDISNLLNNEGILLYSQEHPLVTAPILTKDLANKMDISGKRYFLLSDYNNNSKRTVFWNVDGVIKYHRSFSSIFSALSKAHLTLIDLQESQALPEAVKAVEKYKYQKDRPYYLFIKATK